MKPNAKKLYKIGDIVEMNYGIKPQRVVKIPTQDRLDVSDVKDGSDKGVGVPLSWVKGKLKKKPIKKKLSVAKIQKLVSDNRKICSKLSRKERDRLFRKGMKIVNGKKLPRR